MAFFTTLSLYCRWTTVQLWCCRKCNLLGFRNPKYIGAIRSVWYVMKLTLLTKSDYLKAVVFYFFTVSAQCYDFLQNFADSSKCRKSSDFVNWHPLPHIHCTENIHTTQPTTTLSGLKQLSGATSFQKNSWVITAKK